MRKTDISTMASKPDIWVDDLRAGGDVVRVRFPMLGQVWMTTSYAAAAAMLKDDARLTMRKAGPDAKLAGLKWWMPNIIRLLANNMLSNDEPIHGRLRRAVDHAFRPPFADTWPNLIDQQLDRLLPPIFKDLQNHRQVDMVERLARPFPLGVICEMLGFDSPMTSQFAILAARMTDISGALSFLRAIRPMRRMRRLIVNQMEACSGSDFQPTGGLVAALVQNMNKANEGEDVHEDGHLSEDEVVAMIFLLLMAGHETTTHLISGSLLELMKHRDQWDWLKHHSGDRAAMRQATDELLRHVSPVQVSKPRHVGEDCVFHGVELKRGDMIMAGLASANRDPTIWDIPHQFNIHRTAHPHIEFGSGIHFCLGHRLARLELERVLQRLMEFEDASGRRLALASAQPVWRKRPGLRALQSLPMILK
ncbi:MAG: cytochrome P450 [Pseudomonadota bacterium]